MDHRDYAFLVAFVCLAVLQVLDLLSNRKLRRAYEASAAQHAKTAEQVASSTRDLKWALALREKTSKEKPKAFTAADFDGFSPAVQDQLVGILEQLGLKVERAASSKAEGA